MTTTSRQRRISQFCLQSFLSHRLSIFVRHKTIIITETVCSRHYNFSPKSENCMKFIFSKGLVWYFVQALNRFLHGWGFSLLETIKFKIRRRRNRKKRRGSRKKLNEWMNILQIPLVHTKLQMGRSVSSGIIQKHSRQPFVLTPLCLLSRCIFFFCFCATFFYF